MRTSNYRKQIQLNNKTVKTLKIAGIAGIFALVLFFFAFFHVSKVEVIGIEHYSEKETKNWFLRDLLLPIPYWHLCFWEA